MVSSSENQSLFLFREASGPVEKGMSVEISLVLRVELEFAKLTRTGKAFWAGKLLRSALEGTYSYKGLKVHDKSVLIWLE